MSDRSRLAAILFVGTVLFALSFPAFLQQVLGTKLSDLPAHFSLEQPKSFYSLLIVFVLVLKMLRADPLVMGWSASFLLSTCVALKGILTFHVLSKNAGSVMLTACVAVALALVMPIVNWWHPTSIYLGQFAPTIWHNSTTIIAMPAVILAFFACLRSLSAPTIKNTAVTSGMFALSAATKPSYLIALLPIFIPWFGARAVLIDRMPWARLAGRVAILIGPFLILFSLQSFLIVTINDTWVIVAPFAVWSLYSPHPVASLLLSVAFPLSVAVLYKHELRGNIAVIVAWLTFAVAVAIFILFAEPGPRLSHANFSWGAYMSIYVLFLVSADVFFRQPLSVRYMPVLAFFLMHLASGIYFYWRIVTGLGYTG